MINLIKSREYKSNISFPNTNTVLERIYSGRGIKSPLELNLNIKRLYHYNSLLNIDKASDFLFNAIKNNKKIIIVGDYDTDGATSTTIAVKVLRHHGCNVSFIVPDRFKYGYGLSLSLVKNVLKHGPDIIITVDNGITSIDGVNFANKNGVEVLITDHHLPTDILPNAFTIINPNQKNDTFESKCLAGVGVIFYVMIALRNKLEQENWYLEHNVKKINLMRLMDIVALGTVADVVPLDYNNRIIVRKGIDIIKSGELNHGIRALLTISKLDNTNITASDLAFFVAPKLNASGRLENISIGIQCLLSEEYEEAMHYAGLLNNLNNDRKFIETNMSISADEQVNQYANNSNSYCLFDKTWHEGVTGIIAGRIKEKLHRPVVIFAMSEDKTLKGSIRSINGIHIKEVLDTIAINNPSLMIKYGGHAMAAGLSIHFEKFNEFKDEFDSNVRERLTDDICNNTIYTDGELLDDNLTLEVALLIEEHGPWGHMFPEPVFFNRFFLIDVKVVGAKHLKLKLKTEGGKILDGIYFKSADKLTEILSKDSFMAVYNLNINRYGGYQRLSLNIQYIKYDE